MKSEFTQFLKTIVIEITCHFKEVRFSFHQNQEIVFRLYQDKASTQTNFEQEPVKTSKHYINRNWGKKKLPTYGMTHISKSQKGLNKNEKNMV